MSEGPIPVSLGIDVGGTFTDVVLVDESGARTVQKVPTTSPPDHGVVEAIDRVCVAADIDPEQIETFRHGTTVATNALLTRSGGTTALVTTEGFRDVLEIGRQDRPHLYDLETVRPDPLVPRRRRYELDERVIPEGEPSRLVRAPTEDDIEELVDALDRDDPDSVAVCFLHAYADDDHERQVAARLRDDLEVPVIASGSLHPEFREYERTATTVASAYLTPVLESYLHRLESACANRNLSPPRLMQSNGGLTTPSEARRRAVTTVLSGPAAGVVGAAGVASTGSAPRALITLDMGGTSTDVCLVEDGTPERTTETEIGGVPIRIPTVDITTVGAGGGSIAWVDEGGALRVGPQSAGAEPGPACYDRGGVDPTVTDAALALGLIGRDTRLGGAIDLEPDRAMDALDELAEAAALEDATTAAEGVNRVATATMTRAIRSITIERGRDPRSMGIVAFGGAGGMHAAALADALGIDRVWLPAAGGVLSSQGLVLADEVHDLVRTRLTPVDASTANRLEPVFDDLETAGLERCSDPGAAEIAHALDVRYVGQSFELTVSIDRSIDHERLAARFHREHRRRRGYRLDERIEVVSCRVRVRVPNSVDAPDDPVGDVQEAGTRSVHLPTVSSTSYTVYRGRPIRSTALETPCVVERPESTVVVPPGWAAEVIGGGTIELEREVDR